MSDFGLACCGRQAGAFARGADGGVMKTSFPVLSLTLAANSSAAILGPSA